MIKIRKGKGRKWYIRHQVLCLVILTFSTRQVHNVKSSWEQFLNSQTSDGKTTAWYVNISTVYLHWQLVMLVLHIQDVYQEPTMLHCKHIFCEECVATWFDRDTTCPMCRAQVRLMFHYFGFIMLKFLATPKTRRKNYLRYSSKLFEFL